MIYYLAGPMSGIAESNYPAFASVCRRLRACGFTVVSPHEECPHMGPADEKKYQQLLRHDVSTLLRCEGIILLPGWEQSRGAQLELTIAQMLGMDIELYRPEAFAWLESGKHLPCLIR